MKTWDAEDWLVQTFPKEGIVADVGHRSTSTGSLYALEMNLDAINTWQLPQLELGHGVYRLHPPNSRIQLE